MSIQYDFHLHSDFSGDSETPSEDMICRGEALGMRGMCFTEHLDIDAPANGPDFTLHFWRAMDPYEPWYFDGRNDRDCYDEFFLKEYEMLQIFAPKDYDTLGHMDYVVRYGPNRNRNYSYKAYADFIDPILRFLIEHGKCLELNTGGIKYGLGEPNPCTDVFRRYRELGGELVTVGSDAHEPKHLGYAFDQAAEILTSIGFRYYMIFEQRKGRAVRF
ncbi:MAG: PHP domain-containing protein [Lachnospiraceae bacterium]|nr:PHP domain-containing protein [Lachnospiraceae bacterium]